MASSTKKLQVNTTKLINAIKIRPALYNKDDSMYYSHKKFKYKLWREVCQEVFRNWDNLAPHEKLEYARELQKRWKSLRTCFSRELAYQKKERLKRERNEPFKRRKKYEYFNALIFLLDPNNIQEYTTNNNSESDEDPLDNNAALVEYTSMDVPDADSDQETGTHNHSGKFNANSSQIKIEAVHQPVEFERPLDDKLLDMLRDKRGSEDDEDRMFALSLVSFFKNLDPRKKMEARIEVLKLLQTITYRNDDDPEFDYKNNGYSNSITAEERH